jgi:hypothetical protein
MYAEKPILNRCYRDDQEMSRNMPARPIPNPNSTLKVINSCTPD